MLLRAFASAFVKTMNDFRGEDSPKQFALSVLKGVGIVVGIVFALALVSGNWSGARYLYGGKIVTCHGDECDSYSNRGFRRLESFLDLGYTLHSTIALSSIIMGFIMLLLLVLVALKTRTELEQLRDSK